MEPSTGLPGVNVIDAGAPFRWLAAGAADFMKAARPCLAYGAVVALASFGLSYGLIQSNLAFWVLALTCGFVFIAPMLAMGLYEAGRLIEAGERPTLGRMVLLPQAFRQDVAYLGLALLLIYFMWGRIAQIVYGLSTYTLQHTVPDLVRFALYTSDGHNMLTLGTIIGGVIAFFTYTLVVVSAPMLLDRDTNVFVATITSFRAVTQNFVPMLIWAVLIVVLLLSTALTGFLALVIVFPWLGLASWRAYRDIVRASQSVPAGAPA